MEWNALPVKRRGISLHDSLSGPVFGGDDMDEHAREVMLTVLGMNKMAKLEIYNIGLEHRTVYPKGKNTKGSVWRNPILDALVELGVIVENPTFDWRPGSKAYYLTELGREIYPAIRSSAERTIDRFHRRNGHYDKIGHYDYD